MVHVDDDGRPVIKAQEGQRCAFVPAYREEMACERVEWAFNVILFACA